MEQVLRDAATRAQAFGGMLERRVAKRTEQLSRANETLMRQIQERERTEAALRASEERFAKAFRALPDAGMIARLPEMLIIAVNERWEQMYGYRADRAVGRRLLELGLFRQTVEGVRVLERLRSEGAVRDQEVAMRNRSGAELQVVLSGETVEVAGEPCLIVMMHDMTERRRAEDEVIAQRRQLAHLGRVAVVGELSGALAHELAQPLAAMLANAQAGLRLMRRNGSVVEIDAILRDIVGDLKRSDSVIQRIRALIRREEPRPEPVDANHVVQDVIAIARADLAQRGVTVKTHLSGEIPPALCDRVQMQQVLLNLLVNASDAMASKPPTSREISITSWSAGGGVRLAVADRGTGIAAEPIDTIFEPFVTSKEEGLGLGLTICRTIMQECGGKLWAQNNTRGGATFHLQLPVASEAVAAQPAASMELGD
jgi:two-component system, LuxR family, sensor kinase FixL